MAEESASAVRLQAVSSEPSALRDCYGRAKLRAYGKRWAKRFLKIARPASQFRPAPYAARGRRKLASLGSIWSAQSNKARFVDGVPLFFWGLLEAADEHAPAVHPQIDDARAPTRLRATAAAA